MLHLEVSLMNRHVQTKPVLCRKKVRKMNTLENSLNTGKNRVLRSMHYFLLHRLQ